MELRESTKLKQIYWQLQAYGYQEKIKTEFRKQQDDDLFAFYTLRVGQERPGANRKGQKGRPQV